MRPSAHRLGALFLIFFASSPAFSDPQITSDPPGVITVTSTEDTPGAGNWNIDIVNPYTAGPVDITVEMPAGEFIKTLLVHLPDAPEPTALRLQGTGGPTDPISRVRSIDYTYDTIPEADQRARLVIKSLRADELDAIHTSRPVIRAHEITFARVGQITGAIELNQSRDADGQLTVDGLLKSMFVTGDVIGRNQPMPSERNPITVHGPIEFMQVDGNLGLPGQPIAVRVARLQQLVVGGDFNGQISTMTSASADMGFIQSIRVFGSMNGTAFPNQQGLQNNVIWTSNIGGLDTTDEGVEVTGDLSGDITIEDTVQRRIRVHGDMSSQMTVGDTIFDDPAVANEIHVDGDLDGSIDIPLGITDPNIGILVGASLLGDLSVGGDLAADISIGDDLIGSIVVDEPTGLKGQVIINANDDPLSGWLGDVTVGNITLGPTQPDPARRAPYYSVLSTELGGGAVGLARYDFHKTESNPPKGAKLTNPPAYAELVFYGPVQLIDDDPVRFPVAVERAGALVTLPWGCESPCVPGCEPLNDWVDVSDQYLYSVNGRIVTVNGPFEYGYRYRVRSTTESGDRIACVGVNGSPAVLFHTPGTAGCADDNYIFMVLPVQPLDLTGDGVVDGDDITAWAETPTDVDESETADIVDLIILSDAVGG